MASQDSKINSTNVGVYDYFGSSVGISGINSNTYKVIVGAYNNLTQGNVYVFSNTSTTNWSQTAVLTSNIEIGDNFGYSVDVSEDYSRYIVGAPYKDNNKGRVYIYDTSYSQTEIFAPDSGNFGHSVALNGDGTKAIVGAPYNGSNISGNVYTYSSSNWSSPTHYLYPSVPSNSALFGYSVHISSDGSKTIVGEPYENAGNHGAVYIFNSSGNQEAKLSPSDTYIDGNFGHSVNIDSDGNTAVIGSIGSDNRGAAYVFTRSGTTWTQEAKLVSSDIAIGDNFGHSVSISNDGDTVMVSTPFKSSRGAVYVFTRTTGTSIWTQRDKILSNDLSTGDKFGNSIAISPNSLKAIIGASGETPSNIFSGGSVYSYTLPENYSSNINRITHTEDPGFEDIGTFETFNLYINGQPIENKPTTWSAPQTMIAPSTNLDGSSNIFFANVPYNSNLSTLEPISDIKIGNFTFLERNVYDTWDNTALDFYGEGPPNQMLSVGGEAIIEQKLGIGVQIPVKPIHVLGDMRLTDKNPTNTSVDISSKSSIFRQTFELVPVSQKTYEVHGTFLTLSPDGTTAAVTSYTSPPGNDTFWYVYIYNWNGSLWEQNAVLQPDIIVSNDQFGSSVAFSSDGNTIVIGAYGDESVYVFSRSGFNSISWSQEFKIKESVSTLGNQFGYSVDINGEGSTIVVGSPKSDTANPNGSLNQGSIYVYTRSVNSSWSEFQLPHPHVDSEDRLGTAVSITPDGNTILGTAEMGDAYFTTSNGSDQGDAGAAYIWKKSGSTWSQLTWYPSPNYNEYPVSDGLSVSNTVPTSNIFSYGHSIPGNTFGSATNQSSTRWGDRFGTSCDISNDGNTIIIGAPGRSQPYNVGDNTVYDMGSVYIFKYKYTGALETGYSWVENAHIQASDFEKYDYFGTSVALSSDGNTAIIGSPGHDSSNVSSSGAVYIFTYSGISWSQQYKVTPSVPVINGTFGQCVCLSSDGLVTMLSNNAINVFKPIRIIFFFGTSVVIKYSITNFYGELEYQLRTHESISVSASGHNSFKYNPYTKTWVSVPDPLEPNYPNFAFRITNSTTVYVDNLQLYNPEYVYIWDYRYPSSYLFSFKNPYFNDGYYNSSNVYTYSLPEDYSKQYINTLKVTSNLHVNENITTPNRIGINITTPEKDLHVKGDFRITDESENVDFSIIKENTYEESFLTLPLTGEDILDSYDHYGKCVCISGDGSTIAIASHHSDGTLSSQSDPGKVHIYTRTGNKWSQQVILQPVEVTASGHFGEGLSFSHDGTTLAIGAYNTTVTAYGTTYTNAGAVYVYSRSGRILSGGETEAIKGTWTLENKLIPPSSSIESNSFFGYSVSINDVGDTVLITAKNEESNKGAFYTYAITQRASGTIDWEYTDRTSGSSPGDLVYSVKISGNGLHCVVGETQALNSGTGRIQFYTQYLGYDSTRQITVINWKLVQTITPTGISAGDSLGTYIAIDEIGSTLALSAPNQNSNSGAVYVYTRSNGSVWNLETKLTSLDSGGLFGHDIQLSSDGTRLAIGQPNSGDSVYLYEKIDSKWGIKTKLTASYDGIIPTAVANIGTPTTHYGYSVSMTSDGDRIIVGDHQKTINNMISAGASYIYNIPTITNTSLKLSTSVKTDNDLLVHRNTGLGIESPEKKLHVLGDIRLTNTDDIDISVLPSANKIEQTLLGWEAAAFSWSFPGGIGITRDGNTIAWTKPDLFYIFKRSGSIWYKYSEYTIGNPKEISLDGDGKKVAFRSKTEGNNVPDDTIVLNIENPHYQDQVVIPDLNVSSYASSVTHSRQMVKLSENGDTLLVSYPYYDLTATTSIDGVSSDVLLAGIVDVHVYSSTDNSWSRQARLKSNTPFEYDKFGETIDITGDGNRVFVRAPDRVEIFQRSGTNWSHLQTITNPVGASSSSSDVFGYRISVSSDGRNVAISDPFYDSVFVAIPYDSYVAKGRIYVYYYNGSYYNTATNRYSTITGVQNDYLGYEMRLSGDGKTLLVNTHSRTGDDYVYYTGKTYRYTETNASYASLVGYSPSWNLKEELVPEAETITENYPLYGQNICVNYKGDRCAILMGNGGARATNFLDIHSLSVTNEPTLNISKNLHIEDSLSVGNLKPSDKRGVIHIYEPVGSSHHSTNDASLVLEHGDSGGSSCILFPSARNLNSDYGYIQYEDSTSSGDEKSRLIIGTQNDGPGSNEDNIILSATGKVGIKTDTPQRTLDVNGDSRFDAGVFLNWSSPTLYLQDTDHRSCMLHCNSDQFYILNGTGTNSVNWAGVNGGWALQINLNNNEFKIGGSVKVAGTTVHTSDSRIKKDIVDIDDTSALEKLRLIQPKTYKYRNEEERGSDTVYGFIAQDVSNVLPYAVKTDANPVPTILSSSNVTAVTDTSVQLTLDKTIPDDINLTNTSSIFITVDGVGGYVCPVISTTGNNIITIEKTSELSNITSTSTAYIFGEHVQDFHHLDKNAIFTIATAALQEVDRQLQSEKTKVSTLETQVADLLARVTALENN